MNTSKRTGITKRANEIILYYIYRKGGHHVRDNQCQRTCLSEPVILTKKALEAHSDVVVVVDNTTAMENIKRLAVNTGCSVEVNDEPGGVFRMRLKKEDIAMSGA